MQQNANQNDRGCEEGLIDRRKAAFLIGGILVVLAAILIAVSIFTDQTNASTGFGGTAVITPDRIEQISGEVSEEVMETLSADVLADMIEQSVAEELTGEKLQQIFSERDTAFLKPDKEELELFVEEQLSELGITGENVFTDDQEDQIRKEIEKVLEESLVNISVTQQFSEEEKEKLEEQLKQELSEWLKEQIQNSTYQLTDDELSKIKSSLNIEELVARTVGTVTKEQLERLQTDVINNVEKQVEIPVKGRDYFTETEIQTIQNTVLKKVKDVSAEQIESLTDKVNEVQSSVNGLSGQINELKNLDQDQSADVSKLQGSIEKINESIKHINSVTEELAGDVTISGPLEQVSGSGSEIQSAAVSSSNMTIAEFVDVLAGNGQVYTGAVQELNRIVKQLKDENGEQDEVLKKSLSTLESSLDENGREVDDVKADLERRSQELKNQFEKEDQKLKEDLEKRSQGLKEQAEKSSQELKEQNQELKEQTEKNSRELKQQTEKSSQELKEQSEQGDRQLKEEMEQQNEELNEKMDQEQKARQEADEVLQSQADAADNLIGEKEDAGKVEGDTIFQKIGSIVKILSNDGIEGLLRALTGLGASTMEEGIDNINTDLTDARTRVEDLEKEKWHSGITLFAEAGDSGDAGYTYQESGSGYVYQVPLVTEADQIDLSADDTAIVVEFKNPDRLPSNVAFSTKDNCLLITFTNKPTRNIVITTIHVYKKHK